MNVTKTLAGAGLVLSAVLKAAVVADLVHDVYQMGIFASDSAPGHLRSVDVMSVRVTFPNTVWQDGNSARYYTSHFGEYIKCRIRALPIYENDTHLYVRLGGLAGDEHIVEIILDKKVVAQGLPDAFIYNEMQQEAFPKSLQVHFDDRWRANVEATLALPYLLYKRMEEVGPYTSPRFYSL